MKDKNSMWTIIHLLGILCIECMLAKSATADLATDVQQLLQRVQLVEDKGREYEETIATMKVQIDQLEGKVASLEMGNMEKQQIIDELQDKLNNVFDVTNDLNAQDDTSHNTDEPESEQQNRHTPNDHHQTTEHKATKATNSNSQQTVKIVSSTKPKVSKFHPEKQETIQMQRKLRQTQESVAFHAASSETQQHLRGGDPVVFDTMLLNVGNGYHDHHGLFIAPVSGIYAFSVTVMNSAINNDRIHLNLVRNGSIIGRLVGDGRHGGFSQGSMTIPVQMTARDEVWVEIYYPPTDATFYGSFYTSFSGFLLH